MTRIEVGIFAASVALVSAAHPAYGGDVVPGQNLLLNPGFEKVGYEGPYTSFTALWSAPAAAAQWSVNNNILGTITTELVPSSLPGGGSSMMSVSVNRRDGGIVQVFIQPVHTGPARTISSAWLFVTRGIVTMGTGDGGNIKRPEKNTSTLNEWEYIEAPNGISPSNEIVFYSVGEEGADFYIDNASVVVPVVPGDVDANGLIDLRDACRAVRLLAGVDALTPSLSERCDIAPWTGEAGRLHGNGVFDRDDVLAVLQVVGGQLG